MKKELDQYLENIKNTIGKYLPEDKVDNIHNFFYKLNENPEKTSKHLDFKTIENDMFLCLQGMIEEMFSLNRKRILDSYIEDEKFICDIILKITKLSNHKFDFFIILKGINNLWVDEILSSNDHQAKCYYINLKVDLFNNLDKYGQGLFNLPYLYLNLIALGEWETPSDDLNMDMIVDKLFELLNCVEIKKNDNPIINISNELIEIFGQIKCDYEKNKDKIFKLLKMINLNDYFFDDIEIFIFRDNITLKNIPFFNEMFELFPEMNNFRLRLAKTSMFLDKLDMFDYFLDEKYISELNKIDKKDIMARKSLKKEIPWANDQLKDNASELDAMLFNIYKVSNRELFFNNFLSKKYNGLDLLPIDYLFFKLQVHMNKNMNNQLSDLNGYLSIIKPFLTEELLGDAIIRLNEIKIGRENNVIIPDFSRTLKSHLDILNKSKKINKIKLKL